MAVNQEKVMQMQGTLAGIQDLLVIINERMASFIDNSMMDEQSNKKRTSARTQQTLDPGCQMRSSR